MNYGLFPFPSGHVVQAQLKVLIADITLSANGWIDNIAIPAGFDALEIFASMRGTVASTNEIVRVYINGDFTDTNYSNQYLHGTGAGTSSGREDNTSTNIVGNNAEANVYAQIRYRFTFPDDPRRWKTFMTESGERRGATEMAITYRAYVWESTAPIRSLSFRTDNHPTDVFAAGSRLQVFGVGTFPVAIAR